VVIHKLKDLTFFILIILLGIGFVLSFYYTVNSFAGFNAAVFDWLKSLIYEQEKDSSSIFLQVASIFILGVSTFVLYVLFSSGLSILFLRKTGGFKRALWWKFYKYKKAFLPLWIVKTVAIAFVGLCVFFFNAIVTFSSISIIITAFLGSFVMLNILTILLLSGVFSLSQMVKLNYGTEIALTSPEIDNKSVELLAKNEKINIPLLSIYLFFGLVLFLQMVKTDNTVFLPLLLLNVISYAGIKYLKTVSYIKSRFAA